MSKIVNLVMALLIGFVSSQTYAQKAIKLNPKESRSLTNHFMWTLNATCQIQGKDVNNKILVSVIDNTGQVNGRHLSKGETAFFILKNNGSLSFSAEPGMKVMLRNLGSGAVQAVCST